MRHLAASAAAAAGTLLRTAKIEAAAENVPESSAPFTVKGLPSALVLRKCADHELVPFASKGFKC